MNAPSHQVWSNVLFNVYFQYVALQQLLTAAVSGTLQSHMLSQCCHQHSTGMLQPQDGLFQVKYGRWVPLDCYHTFISR